MESRIKDGNFITIQSFMVKQLNLKGNDLLVYACIYGFSQAEDQKFTGSLQYLADWTNSTKQGVVKCLKSLIDKGLIVKKEKFINNVKFCEYYTTELNTLLNKVEQGYTTEFNGGIKQSLPNNIDYNINNKIKDIVLYLNEKTCSNYRSSTEKTKSLINARLGEGFTVEDFKTVIDKKVDDWKDNAMSIYLRPETLFGTKFESYLNQNGGVKNGSRKSDGSKYAQFS